ncbi:MAG TPA: flagellar biosynthesis anti-sigma factor FlgM [Candidatus Hydrogenedentes bacterium]|nr:flagellar biosynthesis anti-sigma factor FlgM [Candidatus Hydrogenedentota bacterium]
MIGIQGFGSVPKPSGPKQGPGQAKEPEKSGYSASSDGVEFSPEAEDASAASSVLNEISTTSDVRNERVQQAKESIEKGTYRVQDVVRQVASRLSKFVL